ncbi:NADH:flavin oxidoreductase/NADH oxidase [Halobellus litoreus]|uniref:NADH:flavin oxidoreductase/NADH oxidase n=1 Tax=Halobellus litoreus TaxID=755310 RepID=A0ABD6DX64_9EURY|nr:NADH:flavin oxidoreductase/NADH oxidase [Halobellus litoreus]
MTDSLFTPLRLRGTEIPNRVMVSPMCQYSAEDGFATEWHRVHLGSRAVGGAGVVMAEATAVSPTGRISPGDLGIWSADRADALSNTVEFVREQGAIPGIQLAHAGRKASVERPWDGGGPIPEEAGGWETLAPSANPYPHPEGDTVPTRAMTRDDLDRVTAQFRLAAERARDAGFGIAEIHLAHGYLLHEFLSPVTNDRDDEYGGSFENRARFPLEVVEAVREVWPDDQPVFARISATDWLPDRPSWDLDDSARLAPLLAEAGADLIDVSSGGIHPDQRVPESGPGYQVPYAERVNEATDAAVGAVGGITTAEQADQLIRNGRADLAVVGREHLRNPYFTLEAAHELGVDVDWPKQYERGRFR